MKPYSSSLAITTASRMKKATNLTEKTKRSQQTSSQSEAHTMCNLGPLRVNTTSESLHNKCSSLLKNQKSVSLQYKGKNSNSHVEVKIRIIENTERDDPS